MKQVVKIYSGRPGCMCGCKGKYYMPEDRGFTRVLSAMLKLPIKEDGEYSEAQVGNRIYVAYHSS